MGGIGTIIVSIIEWLDFPTLGRIKLRGGWAGGGEVVSIIIVITSRWTITSGSSIRSATVMSTKIMLIPISWGVMKTSSRVIHSRASQPRGTIFIWMVFIS